MKNALAKIEELKRKRKSTKVFEGEPDPKASGVVDIKRYSGYSMTRALRALARRDPSAAKLEWGAHEEIAGYLNQSGKRKIFIPMDAEMVPITRAMGEGVTGHGKEWVKPEYSNTLISEIETKSAILPYLNTSWKFGKSNELLLPVETASVDATWVGEGAAIPTKDWGTAQRQVIARKLAVIVRVPNELLDDSMVTIEPYLRKTFGRKFARKIDATAMFGTGTPPEPTGIINEATATQFVLAADSANGATPTADDIQDIVTAAESEDGENVAFVMAPRTWGTIRKLKDTAGAYILQTDYSKGLSGMLLGYPAIRSTRVPINITKGTSSNCSYMFAGDLRQVHLVMRTVLEVSVFDGTDTAVTNDETWFRGILRTGIGFEHGNQVIWVDGVRP